MEHDLAPTSRPDCVVEMPARFAESAATAGRIAQRFLEIQRATHPILGVLVTAGEPLYGPMDVAKASISNPQTLAGYCSVAKMDAQKVVAAELKRVFGGPLRVAMASMREAFGGAQVYLVLYEEGICAIVPARGGRGRWRLAALRFLDARTMDEERACVTANRASLHTHGIVWNMLVEIARREVREDPGLRADLMDEPVGGSSGAHPPEPDMDDRFADRDYEDPWAGHDPYGDAPADPWEQAPPEPWTSGPDGDGGGEEYGSGRADASPDRAGDKDRDRDQEVDDQAIDVEDPTDPSKDGAPADDGEPDGMETINF